MTRIILHSTTGPDGTLRLDIPLGTDLANHAVSIIIEPEVSVPEQGYLEFLDGTAGAWQGDFERPAAHLPDEREAWP